MDRISRHFPAKLHRALAQLLDAYHYAKDTDCDLWTFAVELRALTADGLSANDLRWLVCLGYLEHALETTGEEDSERKFRKVSNLKLAAESCFVLTQAGVLLAENPHGQNVQADAQVSAPPALVNGAAVKGITRAVPKWDAARRELHIGDSLVKRFRLPSPNQETVLAAFEEERWPEVIDDPLPRSDSQDPKRRLQDTLKGLNRHQVHKLIRFKGNGTGEGILWERAAVHTVHTNGSVG